MKKRRTTARRSATAIWVSFQSIPIWLIDHGRTGSRASASGASSSIRHTPANGSEVRSTSHAAVTPTTSAAHTVPETPRLAGVSRAGSTTGS